MVIDADADADADAVESSCYLCFLLHIWSGWGLIEQNSAVSLQETQVREGCQKRGPPNPTPMCLSFLPETSFYNTLFPKSLTDLSTTIQVPILSNRGCQESLLGNETEIQSSMLCAGGEGRGTNKVGSKYLDWGF